MLQGVTTVTQRNKPLQDAVSYLVLQAYVLVMQYRENVCALVACPPAVDILPYRNTRLSHSLYCLDTFTYLLTGVCVLFACPGSPCYGV